MKKKKTKKSALSARQNRTAYLFLLPWLIGFFLLTLYPFVNTIYLSFNEVRLDITGWNNTWVGMDNYMNVLFKQTTFVSAMVEFIIQELVYVPTIIVISFILALFLNQKLKFRTFFRTIYFLPVIVMSGPVMYQLMDSGTTQVDGLEHIFVYQMIYSYSPFIAEIFQFVFDNFTLMLWFTGIPIILFINGLQKVNSQLYEAASIDGATTWQMLWKITIPLIKPIALTTTIFTIVQLGIFSVNPVYELIANSIGETSAGLGISATYSWLYSIVVLVMIFIAFLLLRDTSERKIRK